MGHAIDYFTTDKRSEIMAIAEEFAFYNVDRGENRSGSYHGRMTIHDDIICECYNDAVSKIESLDRGFYDDHAIRFKDKDSLPPNRTMLSLQERMKKNRKEKHDYDEAHSICNRKSKFVSCPKCESKLSVKYMRGDRCPLCQTELRAQYILDRLIKYDNDYSELRAKYNEAVRNRKDKCKTRWLIKVEVHC